MEAPSRSETRPTWWARVAAVSAILVATYLITRTSVYRLRGYSYPLDVAAALEGIKSTVHTTLPAALWTWAVLLVVLTATTSWVRSRDRELPLSYAVGAAVIAAWTAAYLGLLILGPLGLFRPWVLRILLVVAVVVLGARGWRARGDAAFDAALVAPPVQEKQRRERRGPLIPGWWLAVFAVLLPIGPLALMQLGSPVSPFMDVLPLVAPVQKIATFLYYDPFKNDASGLIALGRNSIGYEAPLAWITLLTGRPAYLGVTSLIVPVSILAVFSTYLLGRTVAGATAGGFATLFLLQTFMWRRNADIRGTALAFSVAAIGLAFFFGTRRVRPRVGLGALALGLGVTVNPLIGAIGMLTASVGTVVATVDRGRSFIAPVIALGAGSLLASPQILIGLSSRVPLFALGSSALIGLAACIFVIRSPRAHIVDRWAMPWVRVILILGLPFVMLAIHAHQQNEFANDTWFGYPILTLLAVGGLAALAGRVWRTPASAIGAVLPAIVIWIALILFTIASPQRFGPDIGVRSLASEVVPKMVSYVTPYWLCIAAGALFAAIARQTAIVPTTVIALVLVMYPLRLPDPALDYSGDQLSVPETWGFHLTHAARGYWAGYADRRWVLDDDWRTLLGVLEHERQAGRIEYDTHVLHIAPGLNSVEVALGIGMSVDLITSQYNKDSIWMVGTRVRGPESLPQAFAERPPYVLVDQGNPRRYPQLVTMYDEILTMPRFHLYRLKGYGPPVPGQPPASDTPPPSGDQAPAGE